jgi:chemotaxis protein methyltransferase CheR
MTSPNPDPAVPGTRHSGPRRRPPARRERAHPEDLLSEADFERFRRLVRDLTGIALGPGKRTMLEARLRRRLRALGLGSFAEYYQLLRQGAASDEWDRFVSAVTTNRTEFFREPHHFAFLHERWAPALRTQAARGGPRTLRVWSAGCSTGEEAYSLAMTLRSALGPEWDLRVLGSDIDTEVLARAAAGRYPAEELSRAPAAMARRWFVRTATPGWVEVRSDLRSCVDFRRINLVDATWPVAGPFQIIFCRNVLIYFDRETQRQIVERFCRVLAPNGLLVLGHAEGLCGLVAGLARVGNTIYRWGPPGA